MQPHANAAAPPNIPSLPNDTQPTQPHLSTPGAAHQLGDAYGVVEGAGRGEAVALLRLAQLQVVGDLAAGRGTGTGTHATAVMEWQALGPVAVSGAAPGHTE